MSPWLKVVRDVIRPGQPELKAQLSRLTEEERRLVLCLQMLSDPGIKDVHVSTDQAAEF